jgi:hypothetical protein
MNGQRSSAFRVCADCMEKKPLAGAYYALRGRGFSRVCLDCESAIRIDAIDAGNCQPVAEMPTAPTPRAVAVGCQFIEGDVPLRGEPKFCGHPRQDRSSYCPEHHKRCWRKPGRPWAEFVQ